MTTETKRTLLLGFFSSLMATIFFAIIPFSRPDGGTVSRLLLYPIPLFSLFVLGAVMVTALSAMNRWLRHAHEAHLSAQSSDEEERLCNLNDERDRMALELARLRTSFSPRLALARRIALAISEGKTYGPVTREIVVSRILEATGNTATEVEVLEVMAGLLAANVIYANLSNVGLADNWREKLATIDGSLSHSGISSGDH